jgi:4-diphosphocytidyl-2-C-methyl-D-erythritol kinase
LNVAPWRRKRTDSVLSAPPEIAAAKVNLYLHVLGRRDDGYHELQSLVMFADCGDAVSVLGPHSEWSISLNGPFAEKLDGVSASENLVIRAARRLAGTVPAAGPLSLQLIKNLPVAAGIGGGSADAAAAVRLLSRVWGCDAGDPAAWSDLGADIPVCLLNRVALVQGMGERLSVVDTLPDIPVVLANPGVVSSTGMVFSALEGRFGQPLAAPVPPPGLSVADLAMWLNEARNDLTRPALANVPAIGEALAALAGTPDVLLARMSGSGSTCFGIYPTTAQADAAAAWLRGRAPGWWIKSAVLRSNSAD